MNIPRYTIPASDGFDLAYSSYFSKNNHMRREDFNRRDKRVNSDIYSYRVLNHWEASGLIDVERGEEGKGWRKYSIADLLWLQIIVELRKFGVSIENIKFIREQLAEGSQSVTPSAYPILEFYTAFYFIKREPVYLMVFDNFQAIIAAHHEIERAILAKTVGNHLRISLHDIIQVVFKGQDLKPETDKKIEVSEQEARLLAELRADNCRSINVRMKDGKIIELQKDMRVAEKELHKIMKQQNYDTITITRKNGKVAHIKQVINENL